MHHLRMLWHKGQWPRFAPTFLEDLSHTAQCQAKGKPARRSQKVLTGHRWILTFGRASTIELRLPGRRMQSRTACRLTARLDR